MKQHIGSNIKDVIKFFEFKEIIGEFTLVLKGIVKAKSHTFDPVLIKKRDLNDLINAGFKSFSSFKIFSKKKDLKRAKFIIYIRLINKYNTMSLILKK